MTDGRTVDGIDNGRCCLRFFFRAYAGRLIKARQWFFVGATSALPCIKKGQERKSNIKDRLRSTRAKSWRRATEEFWAVVTQAGVRAGVKRAAKFPDVRWDEYQRFSNGWAPLRRCPRGGNFGNIDFKWTPRAGLPLRKANLEPGGSRTAGKPKCRPGTEI